MMDVAGWTYLQAAHRTAFAPAGALFLGLLSGLGPCALSRGAALSALTAGAPFGRVARAVGAYAAGAIAGYALYGAVAGVAFRLMEWSAYSYAVLAAVLLGVGVATLVRPEHAHGRSANRAAGTSFLLGCGGSLTLSPCCAPFVVALTASAFGDLRYAAFLLSWFAIGHVLPAAMMASASTAGRGWRSVRPAILSFATGTASLAMGCYFGLLI